MLREGPPELVAGLESGHESVNSAFRKLLNHQRRCDRDKLAEQIRQQPPAFPNGPFDVAATDPPWPIHDAPYPTQTFRQMAATPLLDLLADDAIVWMWTINRFLYEALQIARDVWQLEQLNILTWDKVRVGTGCYLRGQTEHCVLLRRGNPIFTQGAYTTLIREQAREDSRKPELFYRLVEDTCPGSKVELYARQNRPGWHAHGAEQDVFPPIPDGQAA